MKVRSLASLAVVAIVALARPALAANIFKMDFDGIPPADVESEQDPNGKPIDGVSAVLGFYNGDQRPGSKDWDVTFNAPSLAILAGAPGNFPPSTGSGESAVASGEGVVQMTLSSGVFLAGMSLLFNSIVGSNDPILDFFLDGKFVFSNTLTACEGTPNNPDDFCGWSEYKLPPEDLTDRVNRITITSEAGTAVFDDITLTTIGADQPVPEPGSFGLAILGLALASLARRGIG